MTGNGRATMRPGGKSPPFLVIGLLVGLCIIGFNYYKVSSQNSGLFQEISLLGGQIKALKTEKMELHQSSNEVLQACKQKAITMETLKSQMEDQVNSCKAEVEVHKANYVSRLC